MSNSHRVPCPSMQRPMVRISLSHRRPWGGLKFPNRTHAPSHRFPWRTGRWPCQRQRRMDQWHLFWGRRIGTCKAKQRSGVSWRELLWICRLLTIRLEWIPCELCHHIQRELVDRSFVSMSQSCGPTLVLLDVELKLKMENVRARWAGRCDVNSVVVARRWA